MNPIGELPIQMKKYRVLLEFQDEMMKFCNERNKNYKLQKNREEKIRCKETKQKSLENLK